ncbi:hypothetical protein FH972_016102 [Carpinus fangiana]|uniref:Uncharacterized protein n=1 Tax=Carpinus fangiana TaxID=176857 RepID=A0A5N6RET6_9ROSI|nr:hypothetical protein FH972_016102 [Carpinus fangiana]
MMGSHTAKPHLIHVGQPPRQTRVSLSPDQRNRSPAICFGCLISATWFPSSFLEIRHALNLAEAAVKAGDEQTRDSSCPHPAAKLTDWLVATAVGLGSWANLIC